VTAASGLCAIRADRSSATETIFVDTYEHVLQVMEKRQAADADKFDEGKTRLVVRRAQDEGS
jgi:hypothetical protein